MSLFRLVAKLGIDSTEFNAGLKKAESGISVIGQRIAGAFSVAAITAFSASVVKAAGDISDLSESLGITVEQVQALQIAAEHSGVAFDKYAAALSKIRKLKADATGGDKTALGVFASTGINRNDSDFSILQQIGNLSESKAFEILDAKSAKLKNSLAELGKVQPIELMTKENVDALDRASDKLGDMWRTLKAMSSVPLGGIARAILDGDWMGGSGGAWKKEGRLEIPKGATKAEKKSALDESWRQFLEDPLTLGSNIVGHHSTMSDLEALRSKKFSRIDMGDRSNVGGFFGPNADLNSKMQRLSSNVETMAKSIEAIAKVVKGETSNGQ